MLVGTRFFGITSWLEKKMDDARSAIGTGAWSSHSTTCSGMSDAVINSPDCRLQGFGSDCQWVGYSGILAMPDAPWTKRPMALTKKQVSILKHIGFPLVLLLGWNFQRTMRLDYFSVTAGQFQTCLAWILPNIRCQFDPWGYTYVITYVRWLRLPAPHVPFPQSYQIILQILKSVLKLYFKQCCGYIALLAHILLDFVNDDCPAKVLDAVDFFAGEGSVYKAYCLDLTIKFVFGVDF